MVQSYCTVKVHSYFTVVVLVHSYFTVKVHSYFIVKVHSYCTVEVHSYCTVKVHSYCVVKVRSYFASTNKMLILQLLTCYGTQNIGFVQMHSEGMRGDLFMKEQSYKFQLGI